MKNLLQYLLVIILIIESSIGTEEDELYNIYNKHFLNYVQNPEKFDQLQQLDEEFDVQETSRTPRLSLDFLTPGTS